MSIKKEHEIIEFRRAVRFTTHIHQLLEHAINEGIMDTSKLQRILDTGLKQKNITGYSFKPIISYDRKIPDLHYYHHGETIPPDAMILIDIGYKHNGYCADMTRCYNITNHAKKNLYTFVMNIQNYVKRIVRAGMTFQDVEDAYLDEYIKNLHDIELLHKTDYDVNVKKQIRSVFQPHTIGHSIHKIVHEPLRGIFKPNMIITIEPGIYFSDTVEENLKELGVDYDEEMMSSYKKYGGARHEDMFIIKHNGCSQI